MIGKSKKETAEQKLLKMIEATSDSGQKAKTEQKVLKKQTLLSVLKTVNQVLTFGVVAAIIFIS